MATDQEIRDAGLKYIPQQKYLQNPYELPIAPVPTVKGGGITNTNAFTYGGDSGGGALQVGDPMMNFDNYYNYTGNKYRQNQDKPNVDMTYDQKLQSNFMGFPNYRQQELTGPDMGEYIGSGTNIPLEQTMAGKIQSGVQGAGKGIKNLMGMLPTPGAFLSRLGIQNFNSLSPADQLFIKTNTGYRGPTVFGENTGGGNVDPFGMNVESLMGNYAEGVRKNEAQLTDTLTKDRGEGIKFNEITGMFEAIDPNDTSQKTKQLVNQQNKNTKMIRQKFLFRRAQVNQQEKDQRDLDARNAAEAAAAAAGGNRSAQAIQKARDDNTVAQAYAGNDGYSDGSSGQQSDGSYNDPFDPGGGEKDGGFIDGSNRRPFAHGGLASIL
jgi:hypothetical protein